MQLFYSNEVSNDHIILSEQESAHCTRVLRLKAGDGITITDGNGHIYEGRIELAHNKRTSVIIDSIREVPALKYELNLYVAITKHADRLEWMLEKSVELGIKSFTPIITQRTERKNIRIDRLESTILSAMKQSLKAWLPKVNPVTSFNDAIKNTHGNTLIAHCNEGDKIALADFPMEKIYHVFIGPEGDFTPEEVGIATQYGAKPISLGDSRLRTETAALTVVNWMYLINTKTQK